MFDYGKHTNKIADINGASYVGAVSTDGLLRSTFNYSNLPWHLPIIL